MQSFRLSEEELAQVTRRAEEITAQGAGGSRLEETYAAYLRATDELGIPREAVLQALREQLDIHEMSIEPGLRVFAPSSDGFWYAATVESVDKQGVSVRFDAGGTHVCESTELRPLSLVPGTVIHGCWGGDHRWYAARIRRDDAEKNQVTVVYRMDGVVEILPLERIRLFSAKRREGRGPLQWASLPLLDLALKLSAGGALGFLLARLLGG